MAPRHKYEYRHKILGPWYKAGMIIIIIGAILIIIAAIMNMIYQENSSDVWNSFTFGYIGIYILSSIIAILCAILILWLILDKRVIYRINMILFAILLIVLAIMAGNIGCLVVFIGSIFIIFDYLSRH